MFGRIAARYDLGNRVLSLGRDRAWRRRAARESALGPGAAALDVCAGTGDLAFELERRGARVLALDFCPEMLRLGAAKAAARRSAVRFVAGDALALPFGPRTFDAATIAFGLRNLADPRAGLAEMGRVLRPGGRLVVLEFTRPGGGPFAALFRAYARRTMVNLHRSAFRRVLTERRALAASRGSDDVHHDPVPDDHVWNAIQALPRQQRAIVALRFYEDLSEQDIAGTLGVSGGTVKKQLHRAMGRLRAALGDRSES